MNRIKTGVPGLDKILHGGIPEKQLMLLTGTSGTGKTILCNQFIWSGAKKFGQNGIYLSFEEPAEFIIENMKQFGWDMKALEDEGKISYIRYDPYRVEDAFDILESAIREIDAKRVVIDSISALGLHVRDKSELRRMIYHLSVILRKLDCTSIITSEIVHGSEPRLSRYGVEEFVADGVVVFYYERIESVFNRSVQVWKLRGSTHSEKLHPYEIKSTGISVMAEDEAILAR
jgi:KaiC/GvpD/RAD55 family RecA-like ATPase